MRNLTEMTWIDAEGETAGVRELPIGKFQVWMDERNGATINLEDAKERANCIRCFRVPAGGVLRLAAVGLLLALSSFAGTVYFTPKGKTYHDNPHCMALSRAKVVLSADEKEAEAHGLVKCGIEKRVKATAGKKTDNAAWGKAVAK